MKRMHAVMIVLALVLGSAIASLAQNKIVGVAKVTEVYGSHVNIINDAGMVATLEGDTKGIKAGDTVLLVEGAPFLSSGEVSFLTSECQIPREDVDVILQLGSSTKKEMLAGIEKRDCAALNDFKASRVYYHCLKPHMRVPEPPKGWNDAAYLTQDEYSVYLNVLSTQEHR